VRGCWSVGLTLQVREQRGIPAELSEARALELASGAESPASRAKIAAGGTREAFLDAIRSSVDAAREARQGAGSTSVRVAEGRDQLQQMPSDERAADTAAAAQALQNYLAQEAGQQQREEQPFKWDNMADKAARVASLLKQDRRVKPAPAVRDEDSRMETFLATKKAPPRSQAFTIGVDRRGRLDKQVSFSCRVYALPWTVLRWRRHTLASNQRHFELAGHSGLP